MADLPYRIVIGLEVHVQLLTKSKLFCGCSTRFGLPPNSATCPVCIGLPGALPVMNRRAFDLALRAATALNCRIADFTKWDRKNYYYPDLPKNYQISQYDLPFSKDGWLEIETAASVKRIGIIRAHLEEDAGKMLHDETGAGRDSLVDLNRAGTPLLEIVSEPDLSAPEEAKAYLEEIRLLLRETGVSDCEMQEGSLRCDANINIHVPLTPTPLPQGGERGRGEGDGSLLATPIVEVKNLNSFRAVEKAMKYEAERQFHELTEKLATGRWTPLPGSEKVGPDGQAIFKIGEARKGSAVPVEVAKATAGWDEARGRTWEQRRKEEAADYRYFPEPDLVPVVVDAAWKDRVRSEMGELPAAQRTRLAKEYGLSDYDVGVLTQQGRATVAYFEDAARRGGDAKAASNWVTNRVLATLKERKQEISEFPLTAERLAGLIAEQKALGLNKQAAEDVYNHMLDDGGTAKEAIAHLGIKAVDGGALAEIVRRAVAANPKAVAEYKKGKAAAANSFLGPVMRETKGAANADAVKQLILEELLRA